MGRARLSIAARRIAEEAKAAQAYERKLVIAPPRILRLKAKLVYDSNEAARHALRVQLGMHPWRPVGLATSGVDFADALGQCNLPLPARARRPTPRRVVAAARHPEHLAQRLHAIAVPVLFDEPALHSDSRAK